MSDEERIAAFETFVAEQRAKDAGLEAVNLIMPDEPEAQALAAALRGRGWNAETSRGLTFNGTKNEMQLVDFVSVQLAEGT